MKDNMIFDNASETVRFNMLINTAVEKARNKHPELTDADLDRAIRIMTLDCLDRIARCLETQNDR